MSDYEFWNELGNLYLLTGAYEPAIHAYARSIELNRKFGRPYSNMALALTRTGRYREAIELYHRGIELLSNDREKAVSWNRLGVLYSQIKDYQSAVIAYRQADHLDPESAVARETVNEGAMRPLTVAMPRLDMDSLLADDMDNFSNGVMGIDPASEQLTEETIQWFNDDTVPPEPELPPMDFLEEKTVKAHEPGDAKRDVTPNRTYLMESSLTRSASMILQAGNAQEKIPIVMDADSCAEALVEEIRLEKMHEDRQDEAFVETDAFAAEENVEITTPLTEEYDESATNMTEPEGAQYSQMEYPLAGMSPARMSPTDVSATEREIDIYLKTAQNNPRTPHIWAALGSAYKSIGNLKEATLAYQRAVSIDSTKASYFYELGLLYAAQRRETEAVIAFEKTVELQSTHSHAHAFLCGYYRKMGLNDMAHKQLEQVSEDAFVDETDYNRACLAAMCGNTDRALEFLGRVLESERTYVNWAQQDPDLDFVREDPRFHALLSSYALSE